MIIDSSKQKYLILITLIIVTCLATLYLLLPDLVYDNFIWRYFWGPIVSDVKGETVYYHGIPAEDKYTIISELTYGLIIIIVLYILYRLLEKWGIAIDWRFWLAILPFVLTGSVTRVLEDSGFFKEPIGYWFVSPLIYIQILLWAFLFFLTGFLLHKRFLRFTPTRVMGIGGVLLLVPFIWFIIQWLTGNYWSATTGVRIDVLLVVSVLVSVILLLVFTTASLFRDNQYLLPFRKPLNISMLGGHLIDGLTSYISIYDPLGMGLPTYSELHPASSLLMNIWPPLFPIVKSLLVVFIILLFDVFYREETYRYERLVNLLKIGVFILGFAPGTRDLLRVTMGV